MGVSLECLAWQRLVGLGTDEAVCSGSFRVAFILTFYILSLVLDREYLDPARQVVMQLADVRLSPCFALLPQSGPLERPRLDTSVVSPNGKNTTNPTTSNTISPADKPFRLILNDGKEPTDERFRLITTYTVRGMPAWSMRTLLLKEYRPPCPA